MANEFKIKHGFISTGNGYVDGTLDATSLTVGGNAVATQAWVTSQSFAAASSLSSYLPLTGGTLTGNINANGSILGDGNLFLRSYNNAPKGIFFRDGFEYGDTNQFNLSITIHDDGDGAADGMNINAYDGVFFNVASGTTPSTKFRVLNTEVKAFVNLISTGNVYASGGNSTEWNQAYDWGNHASAGYLTSYSETDTLQSVTDRGSTTTNSITVANITANQGYFGSTGTNPQVRIYTENASASIADTFTDTTTDKSYIYFMAGTNSNDPGYIMHETSENASPDERNEGVLHLVPSDDNSTGDYVSIHGTNDPDCIKLHTSGLIQTSSSYQLSIQSGSGSVRILDDLSVQNTLYTDSHGDSSQWNTAYGWGNHSTAGYLTSETLTELSIANNILSYRDENGAVTEVDLSLYLDDTNLARLTSGTLNGATGIATFTRDDSTTFTVDFSALLDDVNNYVTGLSFNTGNGIITATRSGLGSLTVDLDGRYMYGAVPNGGTFNDLTGPKNSNYVAFNASNITDAPDTAWYNGLVTTHSNYLSSYIVNKHRTNDWYLSWRDDSNTPSANWSRVWHSNDFTATNVNNWNTAYGWGNHASAGYAASSHSHNVWQLPFQVSGINIDNYGNGNAYGYNHATSTTDGTHAGSYQYVVSFGSETRGIQFSHTYGGASDGLWFRAGSDNASSENGANAYKNWRKVASTEWVINNYQPAGNYFTDGDTVLNMANNDGLVYNDSNNLMYIKADGTNYQIIDSRGGTFTGTIQTNGGINMNNTALNNLNNLTFNDPGPDEGIAWTGGSGWSIYESPNDLTTNSGGNIQFVRSGNRSMTLDTSDNLYVRGNISAGNRSAIAVAHWSATNNTTGAIKITVPGTHTSNWSMFVLRITTYEYNANEHSVYYVSGHDWTTGWYNKKATILGDTDKEVRLGYDEALNKDYIIIGDEGSTWSYGHVTVDVMAHPSFYNSNMDIATGWAIDQVTDLGAMVLQDVQTRRIVTDNILSGYLTTSGKAADANLLDGINSTSFLRSDATDTASGAVTFTSNGLQLSGHYYQGFHSGTTNYVHFYSNGHTGAASVTRMRAWTGSTYREFTITGNSNNITWGSHTLWTSGNDGTGSGLDADLLDGKHATDFVAVAGDVMTGNLQMGTNIVDFKSNGNGTSPDFTGWRGTTRLNDRSWSTEGGWGYTTFDQSTSDRPDNVAHNANGLLNFNTHGGSYNFQLAMVTSSGEAWIRNQNGGGFNAWRRLLTSEDSSSFAAASHTHSYLPLAGGTLTGDLTIDNNTPRIDFKADQSGSNVGGRIELNENGNLWVNAQGGKDLWLNWLAPTSASSKADLQVGDGNSGSAILTVQGSTRRVGINKTSPAYPLDVVGDIYTSASVLANNLYSANNIYHTGDTDTYVKFDTNRVRLIAGGTTKFDSNETYITRTAPAPPEFVSATVVGETVEVVFNESPTSGVDYYQVWSSVAGGAYGMIAQIPTQDIAPTMTSIDSAFSVSGAQAYRVYAIKNGVYSDPAEGSVTFTATSLDVTNLSIVNLNTAYYIQYEMPDSRFVDHIEIYMDAEVSQGSLSRTGAALIYSGNNPSYMYQIAAGDLDKFHQFWVEVVES